LARATYGADLAYGGTIDQTLFGVGFLSGLQQGPGPLLSFEDKRSYPDFRTGPLMNFRPDARQDGALYGALNADEATLIGQNIEVGLEILRRRRTTCIVLVGTDAIATQWDDALDSKLQIEPGHITKDRCNPSHVTVATIEDLCSHLADDQTGEPWDHLGCDPGLVIVDGCDLVPIETLRKAVRAFRPRYRCGFTHQYLAKTSELMLICHELGPRVYNPDWAEGCYEAAGLFKWLLKS